VVQAGTGAISRGAQEIDAFARAKAPNSNVADAEKLASIFRPPTRTAVIRFRRLVRSRSKWRQIGHHKSANDASGLHPCRASDWQRISTGGW